jgi:hypothetical protein
MTRLNRPLTRTALIAPMLALAGGLAVTLAAPAASADTPDRALYPQSGNVWVAPEATQPLTVLPVAGAAGAAKDGLVALSGPSTTAAVLSTVQHVIDGPVRQAAGLPGSGVDVHWTISPDGGAVANTTEIR